jgi:hypothetical protein
MREINEGTLKLHAEGDKLFQQWVSAQKRVAAAERELCSAKNDLAEATNNLGKWLVPKDAKPGETFNVWYIDALIAAAKEQANSLHGYHVSVRVQGREFTRMLNER